MRSCLAWVLIGGVAACSADGAGGGGGRRDAGGGGTIDAGGGGRVDSGGGTDAGDVGAETACDTFDDDGDGLVDEGCGCVPGMTQGCYPAPRMTLGRGPCAGGTQGCEGSGEFGTWTECVGAVVPMPDGCGDRVDDDCNGTPDDGAE